MVPLTKKSAARARRPRSSGGYHTCEALEVHRGKNLLPLFRLHDRFCRRFLTLMDDPRKVEGLWLLFPFIRDFSVLQLPATRQWAPSLLELAFLAGHDFGRQHPSLADEILAGDEYHHGLRRLEILRQLSGESRLSPDGLSRACDRIVAHFWAASEPDPEATFLELLVDVLRLGFLAGSVAQTDPVYCDFVGNLPERTDNSLLYPHERALVASLREGHQHGHRYQMWHPLLKLVHASFPSDGPELSTVRDFVARELRRLGVRSEAECPADEATLLRWLADGMAYARKLIRHQRARVEQIYAEYDHAQLTHRIRWVRTFAAMFSKPDPERLLGPIRKICRQLAQPAKVGPFVTALENVLHVVELALWIPWVLEGPACQLHLPLVFPEKHGQEPASHPGPPVTSAVSTHKSTTNPQTP